MSQKCIGLCLLVISMSFDDCFCSCLSGIRESLEGVLTSKMDEDFNEVRDSLEAIGFSKQVSYSLALLLCVTIIIYVLSLLCTGRKKHVTDVSGHCAHTRRDV